MTTSYLIWFLPFQLWGSSRKSWVSVMWLKCFCDDLVTAGNKQDHYKTSFGHQPHEGSILGDQNKQP